MSNNLEIIFLGKNTYYTCKNKQKLNTLISSDAFVMSKTSIIDPNTVYDWNDKVVGMFYIKPNYPGRCSHVSTISTFLFFPSV